MDKKLSKSAKELFLLYSEEFAGDFPEPADNIFLPKKILSQAGLPW